MLIAKRHLNTARDCSHVMISMEIRAELIIFHLRIYYLYNDRLCGLMARVPGYRSRVPGPGSPEVSALTYFLRSSGSRTESTQPREYN
jgi:hypothetical protein